MNSFNTHQPFLKYYVENTLDNILEFGCGYGSTPMLRNLIENTDRKLYTFESDLVWLKQMQQEFPSNDNHEYIYVPEWNNLIPGLSNKFGNLSVVFIDQSPWEARYKTLLEFKNKSEYIIIHDVDWFPENKMFGQKIADFNYTFNDVADSWKLYYPKKPWPAPTGPPTLVIGENLVEIE